MGQGDDWRYRDQGGGRHLPPWPPQGQQPYQAPPQPAAPPARRQRAPRRKLSATGWGCLAVLAVLAALAIAVIVIVAGAYSSSKASFTARQDGITVVNPAAVDVTIKVTNTGKSAATPDCTVNASDSSGAYTGVNEGKLDNPVQPGQTDTAVMEVTITHQGAQYVTQATVSCTG